MGNCFPRKNKVDVIDNNVAKQRLTGNRNFTKSIKDGERKMIEELQDQQPSVTRGGLSFVVELDSKSTARPPRRLQKLDGKPSIGLSIKQLDEKQMKADHLRQERKAIIQVKARHEQERCKSALKRREAKSEDLKAKLEAKKLNHEKRVEERRKKLQELAQKTREAKERKAKMAA